MNKVLSAAAFFIFALFIVPGLSSASDRFDQFDFEMKGEVTDVITEDIDQDGLMEAIVIHVDKTMDPPGRYMTIFPQHPEKGFDKSLKIEWTFPKEVAAVDVGDVSAESGKELVFITEDGVAYARVHGGKVGKLQHLIDATSVVAIAYERGVPYYNFVWDYTGDGLDDLLVVGFGESTFVKGNEYYKMDARSIHLRPGMDVQAWDVGKLLGDSEHPVFHVSYHVPEIYAEDTDADGKPDLVVSHGGKLWFYKQGKDGFSKRPTSVHKIQVFEEATGGRGGRGHPLQMAYKDLDDDGYMDLVVTQRQGTFGDMKSRTLLFRGNTGSMAKGIPDQEFVYDDHVMVVFIVDVNGDNKPDLVMPTMELSAWGAGKVLFTGGMNVRWHYFIQKPDGSYPDKADWASNTSLKFSIGKLRLEAGIPNVFGDFNGDGYPDQAVGADKDVLRISLKGPDGGDLGVHEDVNLPVSMFNRTVDMNGDGKSDLIVHYEDMNEDNNIVHILLNKGDWKVSN